MMKPLINTFDFSWFICKQQIRTHRQPAQGSDLFVLVGVNGLEPLTSCV